MKPDVFLSFNTDDRPLAERVCADLEEDGLSCWIAPRNVPGGEDYARVIPDVIRSSGVMILFFSAASVDSPHVEREVHIAGAARIPILPLRLDATEPTTGPLVYFLANTQAIDLSTRPETQFGRVRDEVRRLLKKRGIKPRRRARLSPFMTVITSAVAWAIVAGLAIALMAWLRMRWFNLVPAWRVPAVAAATRPEAWLLVASIPVLALALQYWVHRNLRRVATLDALFALRRSRGAQLRTAGALLLIAAIVTSAATSPGAVSIDLEQKAIADVGSSYTRVRPCTTAGNYVVQSTTRFAVTPHVGRGNPQKPFQVQIEIAPYATADGVELCEVWIEQRAKATFTSSMDSPVHLITVTGVTDAQPGVPVVFFNVQHYRDSQPAAAIKAWLVGDDFRTVPDHEPVPKSIRASE